MAAARLYCYRGVDRDLAYLTRIRGVNRITIASRIKRGWSVRKAVETPAASRGGHGALYDYKGEKRTLYEIAEQVGMSFSVLRGRVERAGWSLEKALATPTKRISRFENGHKVCPDCDERKAESEFPPFYGKSGRRRSICRTCCRIKNWEQNQQRRREAIAHYSGDQNCCAACGETNIWVLDIDHINGRPHGARRRDEPQYLAKDLRQKGYPKGFRVLCRNCNWLEHLKRQGFGPYHPDVLAKQNRKKKK